MRSRSVLRGDSSPRMSNERGDRGRIADGHQLLPGLDGPVFGAGDDRLTQERIRRAQDACSAAEASLAPRALASLPRDPPALVADQALHLADLVGGEPAALVQDMAQLPMRRGERLVVLDGGLIMEPGQVAQLVALAPEAQLVLRIRRSTPPDRAGRDIRPAGRARRSPRRLALCGRRGASSPSRARPSRGRAPRSRSGSPCLAPSRRPGGRSRRRGPGRRRGRSSQRRGGDDQSRGPGDRTIGHESTPLPARAGRNGRVSGLSSFYGPPEPPDNHLQAGIPIW